MSSSGVLASSDVFAMLRHCAEGVVIEATEHYYRIKWNGRTYPSLPLGDHGGKRKNLRTEIKVGDVRKLLRFLGVSFDCAKGQLPRLGQ